MFSVRHKLGAKESRFEHKNERNRLCKMFLFMYVDFYKILIVLRFKRIAEIFIKFIVCGVTG